MKHISFDRVVVGTLIPILLVGLMVTPFSAGAQSTTPTQAQLQAQLATLLAQVQTLQTQLAGQTGQRGVAGVPANYTFTRNLSQGMSGQDVQYLQRILNSNPATRIASSGPGSPGNETMHFGPMTRDAVNRFQTTHRSEVLTPLGLTTPTGLVGPATRSKLDQLARQVAVAPTTPAKPTTPTTPAKPTTPDPDPTPTLSGGEGEIDVKNRSTGTYEVRLGREEIIYETEVTAVDSDVALNRVDVHFGARPWLYFDEVRLLIDGDVVAKLSNSSSNYTAVGSNYRARFTNLNTIVREGDTVDIDVEVKAKSALAGNRVNDTVTVRMPDRAIRMVDGTKTTGYGPDGSALSASTISFEDTFGTATLNLRLGTDSPVAQTIRVENTARTTVDPVLVFRAEAKDQRVTVDDVSVRISVADGSVSQMVHRARLYAGNTLLSTQTVPSGSGTQTVTFSELNRTIARDSSTNFRVVVDLQRATQFTVPNSIEVVLHEVRAESDDTARIVKDNLKIGSGVEHTVIRDGGVAAVVSKSAVSQANETIGTFTFAFDLTAFGNTYFIDEQGINSIIATTTTGTAKVTSIGLDSNATLTSNGNYRLNEGQTRRFTVSVIAEDATQNGFQQVTLQEIRFGTSDSAGTPTGQTVKLGAPDYRSPSLFLRSS